MSDKKIKERYSGVDCNLTRWELDSFAELYNPETNFYKDSIDCGRITSNIYLGSYNLAAKAKDGLKLLGVTHILTMGHKMEIPYPGEFEYKVISIPDSPDANITQYFDECIDWIETALREPSNVVLIHCYAGISRSATITIAYLMKSKNYCFIEAIEKVRQARFWVHPNAGFRSSLYNYNIRLELPCSKEMIQLYEQCFSILRKVTVKKHKLQSADKSFVIDAFQELFGIYHPATLRVQQELKMLS